MSCNTKTSLAAVIDAVNAQLNNNYVDRDDPRINQGVFTEPTIRGGLMLDEAAKLDFCGYVTECGQREPFGKQWVDRPLYPHNTLVSYEDEGEIKSRWQDTDDVVAGTEIGESYTAYEETRSLGLQGYTIIDSFELGATITQRDQALRHAETGELYRWAGDLPKIVPADSTPDSSGGVDTNAWLEVSDAALRQEILTGGLLTDTLVTATAPVLGAVARSQRDKNSDVVSVKDFGAKGDNITDDSEAFQSNATYAELNKLNHIKVPVTEQNYILDSPIVFNIPQGVRGDSLPRYNRHIYTNGNIVLRNTDVGLKLGNGNGPDVIKDADQWSIVGVSFLPEDYTTGAYSRKKTQTAIEHHSRANKPERGFYVNEFSANTMKYGIHIKNGEQWTDLANLNVTNSCINNNMIALLAEGNIVGMRFEGNQAEQCDEHVIKGSFAGNVAIRDNMIEGSKNTIYIYQKSNILGSAVKNPCRLVIEGNYLESCRGDYLISLEGYYKDVLISNNCADYTTSNLHDHIKLSGTFRNFNNANRFPVFFYPGYYDLSNDTSGLASYKASLKLYNNPMIFSEYRNTPKHLDDGSMKPNYAHINNIVETNEGLYRYLDTFKPIEYSAASSLLTLNTGPLEIGEVVTINIAYFAYPSEETKVGTITPYLEGRLYLYNDSTELIQNLWAPFVPSEGKVKTLTIPYRISKEVQNSLKIGFRVADSTVRLLALSYTKEGTESTNQLDESVVVFKHNKPALLDVNQALKRSVTITNLVPANTTTTVVLESTNIEPGNQVSIVSHSLPEGLTISAYVSSPGKITLKIKNGTEEDLTASGEIQFLLSL